MTARSSSTVAMVRCTTPCGIISQPAATVRSRICGTRWQTAEFTLSVARASCPRQRID